MTRQVKGIIIHAAATPKTWMADKTGEEKVAEIRRWHVEERGWADIGYNHVIDRDGKIYNARDRDNDGDSFEEIGAHTRGKNSTYLGVCLIGGKGGSANDAFADHFTPEQGRSLRRYIAEAKEYYPSIKEVRGHNEFAAKACPSFDVQRWLKRKPPKPATVAGAVSNSKTVKTAGATAVLATVSEASGDAKNFLGNMEQALGVSPLVILVVCVGAYIIYDRVKKYRRGVT
jgi:hypothetical protein